MQKEDIWDSKHLFRNETRRCILEPNLQTETLDELQAAAKANIKSWIAKERPAYYTVDGPWQTYVMRRPYHKRIMTMKTMKSKGKMFFNSMGSMLPLPFQDDREKSTDTI